MKEYSYLVDGPGRDSVLARDFKSPDLLVARPVLYNMARSSYLLFDSLAEFIEFYTAVPAKTYCEVVWGALPQRLKLDIDAAGAEISEEDLVSVVRDSAEIASSILWPDITPTIHICLSSGADKVSFHVVIDAFVSNNLQCAAFTEMVARIMPPEYAKYVDLSVNKSTQNFRLAGSHKPGSTRVKQLPPGVGLVSVLIRSYEGTPAVLPDITEARPREVAPAPMPDNDDHVREALTKFAALDPASAFLNTFRPAGFYAQLNFKRMAPSHCQICSRVHDHDNTFKLLLGEPAGGKIAVFQGCRHSAGTLLRVGEIDTGLPDTLTPAQRSDAILTRACMRDVPGAGVSGTKFDSLQSKLVYDEPALRDFMTEDAAPTICVRARMKMGKTKKLREMIERYYPAGGLVAPRIVMLSFRQTFSGNIKQAFPDFTLYSDVHGELRSQRTIVQVESLHRLSTAEPVDLFIMDECESILAQFSSGLIKDFSHTWACFAWLMRYSARVICMDAYLSDRTFNVLKTMRPGFEQTGHFHNCIYKNATADSYSITHNRALWFGTLFDALEAGNKVAIPISSLTEARGLEAQLRARFPQRSIKLYSSETSRAEARTHFADVAKYWSRVDVLIYTPTVSAGVSFELAHFDYVFGYFVHTSCDAATAHQMIGRIRDVKTHNHYIYIAPGRALVPTTREGIRAMLIHRRQDLMREYDATLLNFQIGRYGNFELIETDYLTLWIENVLMTNQSRAGFAQVFIALAREGGAVCATLDEIQLLTITATAHAELIRAGEIAIAEHKEKKSELSQIRAEAIAAAEEITPAAAAEIKQAISLQQEVTAQDKHAYEKYKLRAGYKYTAQITAPFVQVYIGAATRQVYRNLARLVASMNELSSIGVPPTHEAALALIQRQERELMLRYTLESPVDEVNNNYSYGKHKAAHAVALMCGWKTPFVHEFRAPIEVFNSLGDKYWTAAPPICLEFGARMPTRQQCASVDNDTAASLMIKPLSAVLNAVYGVTIATSTGSWYLKPHPAFKIVGPVGDQTIVLSKG